MQGLSVLQMMDKIEAKKKLRQEIKAKIMELDADYCVRASERICQRVIAEPSYQAAETVFCFVGTGGEPDTRRILRDALEAGKRVGVPLCISDGIMEVRQITDLDRDLRSGYFGILEPLPGQPRIDAKDIDFAVLPCVTCDHQGNRLGHGKGYYDRFLQGTDFPTCMICFEALVSEGIPMDAYDQRADSVITDAE